MWNECTWMQQTKKASDITEQFKGTTVAKRLKKILSRKLTQQNNKKSLMVEMQNWHKISH